MFAEKIGESCSTTGTGTFSLGGAYNAFNAWGTGFASGAEAFYLATNDAGTIWEIGYGTFTNATPDTLTRTLIASSSGSLISWVTTPYRVYNIPTGMALKHMLAPLVNGVANVPTWLPAGALWIDYSLGIGTAWVTKRYVSGSRTDAASHVEISRHYLGLTGGAANISAASQRSLFVDKGANNYVFTAADVGKTLAFNTTAATRTLTMLANDAAGMGHGAYVWVLPYSTTSVAPNGVTFTPGGSDTTDLATAPPNRRTLFMWDGARGKWVADYVAPATQAVRSYLAGLTLSAAGSTGTFGVAAGVAADGTGAAMMTLGSAYTKTTSAWAVGSGNGSLDTGTIANDTWYHVWQIERPDTGVVDILTSLSVSAPTMPANYTLKRRIGSMKTDGSAQWIKFIQDGDYFAWAASVLDVDATNPGTSAVTRTLTVPPGVNVHARLNVYQVQGSNVFATHLSDLAVNDEAPSATVAPLGQLNGGSGTSADAGQVDVRTNTSAQIRSRISVSGAGDILRIATIGWFDRRGRDA